MGGYEWLPVEKYGWRSRYMGESGLGRVNRDRYGGARKKGREKKYNSAIAFHSCMRKFHIKCLKYSDNNNFLNNKNTTWYYDRYRQNGYNATSRLGLRKTKNLPTLFVGKFGKIEGNVCSHISGLF